MRLLVSYTEGKIFGKLSCTLKHNQPALRIKVPARKQFTKQAV